MNIETQIEFDKIKAIWAEFAVTEKAKAQIREKTAILEEIRLRKELRDTTDSREMLEKVGMIPLQDSEEIKEIVTLAEKGGCLTPYQLERVKSVLIVIGRLKHYLARGKSFENPLAYYDMDLQEHEELREEIARQIRVDQVDDHASKYLEEIRSEIAKCEDQMKQKAETVLRAHKDCMSDSFYAIRNGRVCVPVKKEYKFKIPGSVIDKSATGATLFIEPVSVAKYHEELELYRIEEENEVYRILYTLSAMTGDIAEDLAASLSLMERLDYIFSKGKLSLEMSAVEPGVNLERRIRLVKARHPLMDKAVAVPLDFELGGPDKGESTAGAPCASIKGVIITGPNTGGKTVAIKTVMLASLMAQCGLHVPCQEADLCMNSKYLCDIGDGQNLSENLSTFSAHIRNVLEVLKEVDPDSFVIMDELGSGTDPTEGMGIAIAILEELRKSGANFLVTTHYPEVKEYAEKTEGILNARMTFDKETLKPTYRMVIGEAGESCAFYIADTLGMPEAMLKTAIRAAYGDKAVNSYTFHNQETATKQHAKRITKAKKVKSTGNLKDLYHIGDSVMVYPDKKIGIVCEPVNDQGVLRVQIAKRKFYVNHKRVKLHVRADQLYPEDYDFSIIFDSVENRKLKHDMGRKYTEGKILYDEGLKS